MAQKLWTWFVRSIQWCDHVHNIDAGLTSWGNMKNILDLIHVYRPDIVNAGDVTNTGQLKLYSKIFASIEMNCGIPLLFLDAEYYSEDNPNNDLLFLTYVVYLNAVFKDSSTNCAKKGIDTLALACQMPFIRPFMKNSHSSSCIVCNETVFILERFIVDQQLRHRKCFFCVQCKQLLYIGLYKKSKSQSGDSKCPNYECLEHEKETFLAKISMSIEEESTDITISAEPKIAIISDGKEPDQDRSTVGVEKLDDGAIIIDEGKDDTLPDKLTEAAEDMGSIISRNYDSEATNLHEVYNKPQPPPRIKKKILSAMLSPRTSSPSSTVHSKTDELCSSRVELYPEDLNPFGAPSGDEAPQSTSTSGVDSKRYLRASKVSLNVDSTNPFLSDDDDVKSISSSVSSSWNVCDEQSELHDVMDVSLKITDSESSRPSSVATNVEDNRNRIEKFSKSVGHRSSGYSSISSSATKKYVAPKPPAPSAPANFSKGTPDVKAKKRMAPPPPLPLRRQIIRDSTITSEAILDGFIVVGRELADLETKGRILEEKFNDKTIIDEEFLDEWVHLCEEKMRLIRKQNDFAFLLRERQLNELHTEVEYQLRCLIEKPEKLKRAGDEQKEAYLLQKLLNVIEEKSRLVESCVAEDTMNSRKVDVNDKSDALSSENLSKPSKEKKHATTKKLIKSRLKTLKKKIMPNKS